MRTRRDIVGAWLAATGLGLGPSLALTSGASGQVPETPACGAPARATPRQIEGPFFLPRTPARRSFRGDAQGEPISLIGTVSDTRCRPLENAIVDLWHADAEGAYDEQGFRLRGHQPTDGRGRYAFDTILPGAYPGRTRHLHVKIARPGGAVLTTQIYFPNEPGNRRDDFFDPRLVMTLDRAADGLVGRFDFVLRST